MIELGKKQTLQVVKKVEFGVYLGEDSRSGETERVLLCLLYTSYRRRKVSRGERLNNN